MKNASKTNLTALAFADAAPDNPATTVAPGAIGPGRAPVGGEVEGGLIPYSPAPRREHKRPVPLRQQGRPVPIQAEQVAQAAPEGQEAPSRRYAFEQETDVQHTAAPPRATTAQMRGMGQRRA